MTIQMARTSPLGQLFHARDGGLHSPLDGAGLDFVAAQNAQGDRKWEVLGTAVRYGVVGHFGFWGAMRLEAGSVIEAPGKHRKYRDVMALYSHDSAQVLGRVGSGTLGLAYGDEDITYSLKLNPADSLAQNVWARLVRGDINSASIGFIPVEGDWVEAEDNSLDADPDAEEDAEIEVFAITRAELVEVSLVAQGAFAGATSAPATGGAESGRIDLGAFRLEPVGKAAVEAVMDAVPGGAEDTIELELRGAMPVGAIVGDDDTAEPATAEGDAGAPADFPEGSEGGEPERAGEDFGGAAEPDDGGSGEPAGAEGQGEGAEAEAERQGLTLKEIVGRTPYELRRRLLDGN